MVRRGSATWISAGLLASPTPGSEVQTTRLLTSWSLQRVVVPPCYISGILHVSFHPSDHPPHLRPLRYVLRSPSTNQTTSLWSLWTMHTQSSLPYHLSHHLSPCEFSSELLMPKQKRSENLKLYFCPATNNGSLGGKAAGANPSSDVR